MLHAELQLSGNLYRSTSEGSLAVDELLEVLGSVECLCGLDVVSCPCCRAIELDYLILPLSLASQLLLED